MKNLNLKKFPIIENVSGLLKYDPFVEFPNLLNLGEISERIYGCAEFTGAQPNEKYKFFNENAHLRAFLNEFSSLNEVLKASSNLSLNGISIENTELPLFHFLKLLRNVNFHVVSICGGSTTVHATLYNKETNQVVSDPMTIIRYIIADCNITLLSKARDIKYYKPDEMQATIDWVDNAQRIHGISDVLEAALRQYCALIESTLN